MEREGGERGVRKRERGGRRRERGMRRREKVVRGRGDRESVGVRGKGSRGLFHKLPYYAMQDQAI